MVTVEKPVISIVGFKKSYSDQMSDFILRNQFATDVKTLSNIQGESIHDLNETDVAIINGYDTHIPDAIRLCTQKLGCKPPACLIIGNKHDTSPYIDSERRHAPRLHLSNREVSQRILKKSLDQLTALLELQQGYTTEQPVVTPMECVSDDTTRIGKYRITNLLGEGGMGAVYQATDPNNNDVAIKLIDTDRLYDYRIVERFMREYDMLSTVNHPNVIRVHEQGFTDNHLFIVMDLLTADSLKSRVLTGLSLRQSINYAISLSQALATIHDLGILHRDIKPINILFDKDDQPVITDFGVSKFAQPGIAPDLTKQGEAVGTPAYMSPEQALGNEVTPASDLYSFGVMLYQMVTGQLPFRSKKMIEVMQHHVTTPPPHLPPELVELDPIIQQLLCKQPSSRPSSAWEVYEQLKEFEKELDQPLFSDM